MDATHVWSYLYKKYKASLFYLSTKTRNRETAGLLFPKLEAKTTSHPKFSFSLV